MTEDAKPHERGKHASPETKEFIYQHTKDGPNLQIGNSNQLDTKITTVFAAATVALGLAARLPKTEGPRMSYLVMSWSGHINLVDAFFYFAVAAWGVVALTTLLHVRTKKHLRAIHADTLWTPKYRHETVERLKRIVLVEIRDAYVHNQGVLASKARTFNRAVTWAAAEGAFLVLALALARSVS